MPKFALLSFGCCTFLLLTCCNNHKTAAVPTAVHEEDWVPTSEVLVANPKFASHLVTGFHPGSEAWKWTGQTFTLQIDPPEPAQPTNLALDFTLPIELLSHVNPVVITAKVNGVTVGQKTYTEVGRYSLVHEVPDAALQRRPAQVEYTLNGVGSGPDGQPRGLIVVTVGLPPRVERPLAPDVARKMARAGYKDVTADRRQLMPDARRTEFLKLFHDIPVWRNTWFHNVQIEKNPLDLWMMQQIIYEIQPDFIIETGAWHGGSALYWAHTLNGMGLDKSRVISIDIANQTQTAATHPLWKKYVDFILGSSTDPKIVAQVRNRVQGRKVIITLDSDHSMKHVLNELRAYAPFVSPKSYLVVEDTHMDGVPTYPEFGPGPMAAVRAFLAEPAGRDFEIDPSREAMIMTFNPGGWLRHK